MQSFDETADKEIRQLKEYYEKLSNLKKYFFPHSLKIALESYNDYQANGSEVYKALFNTNWFLMHWPFFSFLSQFASSNQNAVAKTFRLANKLYGLNSDKTPSGFNNFAHEVEFLLKPQ